MAKTCERCGYPPESWLRTHRVSDGRPMRLCELCIAEDNHEPGDPDGEAYRGNEAAAHLRDMVDELYRLK